MAEGRMLKKEIANSKKLFRVSDKAKVIYFMMLPHTDIKGRVKACPEIVGGQYLTMLKYTEASIQNALNELHKAGLIILYTNNNDQFAEYTRFGDFQKLRPDRESETKIPGPTQEDSGVMLEDSPLSKVKLSKDKLSLSEDKRDESPIKIKYLDFVLLTKKEHWKLTQKLKGQTEDYIERLNGHIGSKGTKYVSHFHTILNWHRKDLKDPRAAGQRTCVVDHKVGYKFQEDSRGNPVYLCEDCWLAVKGKSWGKLPKNKIERLVETGRAKRGTREQEPDWKSEVYA